MLTQQDVLDRRCTWSDYCKQWVTSRTKELVSQMIGLKSILASTDPHMNDIDLYRWDRVGHILMQNFSGIHDASHRPYLSLSTMVSIAKESAKELKKDCSL